MNIIENSNVTVINEQELKYQEGMDSLFGLIESPYKFKSFRDAYIEITKDPEITGVNKNKDYDYSEILTNTIQKYFEFKYSGLEKPWLPLVYIQKGIHDFCPKKLNNVDSYKPEIRAGMFSITKKDICDNSIESIQNRIIQIAVSANKTLNTSIGTILIGGFTYLQNNSIDSVNISQINTDKAESQSRSLYTLENAQCLPLTEQFLQIAIQRLTSNSRIDNGKTLVIPDELQETWGYIIEKTHNESILQIQVVALSKQYLGNSEHNWYILERGNASPIQIGFVDDQEDPKIMLANNLSDGLTFSKDELQFACSHQYGGGISNWRNIFGSIYVN